MGKPAPRFNKYACICKTKKDRLETFYQLLLHLEKGLGVTCFPQMSWDTIQQYLEKYPKEFVREYYDSARRMGQLFYERLGQAGMSGKISGFNSATYRFFVINKYGWKENGVEGDSAQPQKMRIVFTTASTTVTNPDG